MQTNHRLEHRQQATLSPRLQHAVRLLQLSSLDFAQELQTVLSRNPFLEEEEPEEASEAAGETGMAAAASADAAFDATSLEPSEADPQASAALPDGERDPWLADGSMPSGTAGDKAVSALDLTPVDATLRAHLHAQLSVLPLPMRDLVLARAIVESLDDDGYLRQSLDDAAEGSGLDPRPSNVDLRIALKRVQSLEPAGVAARNVAECLLLQLPTIECPLLRETARRMITAHLDRLAARDVPKLAALLDESQDRVRQACDRIRRLDPRPGWRYGTSQIQYITPDVIVKRVRREWTVALNPAIVPRVRMNQVYADMFARHRDASHGDLAAHLREARWTVHNVEQRFQTILGVAQAIVRRQSRFFDLGPLAMRPLGLREIAEEVGLHESTVSRVTNNKYMATPAGVLELKYFFSRAMTTASGGKFSGTAIRGLIGDMIQAEAPGRPMSDAQIARLLAQQGFMVARRTVTKYRQQLRIEAVERRAA
ncbi:MAG: RNA polymerase factor sigma-54 [Proteobacteria bacterium]|nr:RNA polymerase factor sigma-54 [Pseudomonadota bacterium]